MDDCGSSIGKYLMLGSAHTHQGFADRGCMVHLFFTAYSSGDQEAAKMCKGRCCSKLSAWLRAALKAYFPRCSQQ